MHELTSKVLAAFWALDELTEGISPAGSTRPEVLKACGVLADAAAAWISAGGPDRDVADPRLRDALAKVWAMRTAPPLQRIQDRRRVASALEGLPPFAQVQIRALPPRARAELARCQERIRGSRALTQVLHDTLGIPPELLDPMAFAVVGVRKDRAAHLAHILLQVLQGTAEGRSLPELVHLWSWWGAILVVLMRSPGGPLRSTLLPMGPETWALEVSGPEGQALMIHLSWSLVPAERHEALQRAVYDLITVLLAAPAAEEV